MTHPFIQRWSAFEGRVPPFILPGDELLLTNDRPGYTAYRSLDEYTRSAEFGQEDDRKVHLGLRPLPFVGPVERATVYLLMLNPGLHPADYLAEWHQPAYAKAAAENLRGRRDFLFLDPEFAWHPGFSYWQRKLGSVLRTLAASATVGYSEMLRRVARRICTVELFPYHSASFGVTGSMLRKLASPSLAIDYVRDVVVPRARNGDAHVIVTRAASYWDLPADCAVVYGKSESRGAHLTSRSKGGARILEALTPLVGKSS